MHSAEQQLNLILQQNEAQQRMISHISCCEFAPFVLITVYLAMLLVVSIDHL
jgi:hypothetical protein